jgi:hypothetical protein
MAAHAMVVAGVGLGYRYRACDLHTALQWFDIFADEVVNGATMRLGLGLQLSCRAGRAQ